MAPPVGFEPTTYGLAHHCNFHCQEDQSFIHPVCGPDHIFAVSGGMRMASTEPYDNQKQSEFLISVYS